MLTSLGVIFISFTVVRASFVNETFLLPDITSILRKQYSGTISDTCKAHLGELELGLKNKQLWALHMIDSTAKIPEGLLVGHLTSPGIFDECVNAVNEKFSGKHCMIEIKMKSPVKDAFVTPKYSLYGEKRKASHKENTPQLSLRHGICIPSTCNSTDIINIFRLANESIEDLNKIDIKVTEADCSTKEFRPFRAEDWITVAVLIALVLITLGSTAYDLFEKFMNKKGTPNPLWASFSLYTNGKHLFSISESSSQLKCLHGMRSLSMFWVILGHSYFSFLSPLPLNMFEIPNYMNDKSFLPVSNGFLSVDSFFFLSGLLVCLVFFRDISKKKSFDVPVAFIHRYMRLTPPFALLVLIQSTIISRLGNGPFWNTKMDEIETQCRESWWEGLLYIQNYRGPLNMCLGQTWYLSADMQMYWVSPLILYPMLWFPSFAPVFILILVLAAAFTNFAIAFVNGLSPNFLFEWGEITIKQFELDYAPFHTRMAPWLIGLATGYIICGIQAKKIRLNLSKFWVTVGWLVGLSLLGSSLFAMARFVGKTSDEFTQVEASLYLAFHRVGWAVGMGWVVIACIAGYGGPVNSFLSLDFFQPIAKLSYCNFLLHMTLQNFRTHTSRINPYLRHFEIVYAYIGDLVISHIISIPVVLLFEIPFSNIDRHFFQKLVIFPYPKPKKEKKDEEKEPKAAPVETPVVLSEDVEKGEVNRAFSET